MSKRLEEFTQMRKTVDPQILMTILLDEMCGRLDEVSEKLDKIGAFVTYMGPTTRVFKQSQRYQFASINAGANGRVYHVENPQPELLVGVVTQVANSWFPNTYLEWFVDYMPTRVDYIIANINNPKEYVRGIPFRREVEWIAYNDDAVAHVFGVLCDGFFINREIYDKIVNANPE